MVEGIFKWVRKVYNKMLHSIAFLPAIMGVAFLLLAVGAMEMDAAGLGLELNRKFKWLTLKDVSTARTIVATVAAGIISLTVFSFSMVMIVMNQAASQMSNRMLDNIIGDKIQKYILGFYIGTIVFALFLLTNISETEKAINVPSLSVYFLLLLTMFDIFLFVYFLHYITQSFRYEQLIQRIHHRTTTTLNKLAKAKNASDNLSQLESATDILSRESGYYQGFDQARLLNFAVKKDVVLEFLHPIGTYILKGTPLLRATAPIKNEDLQKMLLDIDFYYGQEIDKNAYYGFLHLTEVAVKALSPGINDPGTAVLSIHALTDLLAQFIKQPIKSTINDGEGKRRIVTRQLSFEELYNSAIQPIWDYGKNDRIVQQAFIRMLQQLMMITEGARYLKLFENKMDMVKDGKVEK
jgi:uncharacterized membrane protein